MKVTIKGIYSTGLIKLFLDHGFELTNLSDVQRKRFGIASDGQPDVSIRDLKDRSGISVLGEGVEEVINFLKEHLWDSLYLRKSENLWYVILGGESKKLLDRLRKQVVPTIESHHTLRRDLSTLVDFSEILLEEVEELKIRRAIKRLIVKKLVDRGVIKRFHRRLDGTWFSKVEVVENVKIEEDKLVLETIRVPKPGRTYDGLEKPIEPGDFIKTKYVEGSWFFPIRYYDKNRNLKGVYFNINTPLEITHKKIQYIDLAVDVVKTDSVKVLDLDELKEFYERGNITKRLFEKAREVAKELCEETITS
jgi:hypothetical protein